MPQRGDPGTGPHRYISLVSVSNELHLDDNRVAAARMLNDFVSGYTKSIFPMRTS
jgi:hypothetical protein